jgi:hypothetical protein
VNEPRHDSENDAAAASARSAASAAGLCGPEFIHSEGACSNISIAYHLRWKREELYAAYGDPNALVTVPQALLKLIFYAGAEKGI